ncbi:MAG: hypothetical protein PUD90_10610 [Clostridia bacterium]|nr:hypothetical protein [Clostridia bacterium]
MRLIKRFLIFASCIFMLTACGTNDYQSREITEEISGNSAAEKVDYDLTEMTSDMVYAMVYQTMADPQEYSGKKFRIDGTFYPVYYEPTKKYYYYCVIKDAAACCAQGIEFVWDDGRHIYPDEYPEENSDIVVEWTFETYREAGDDNLYCRLSDAKIWKENNK